MASSTLGLSMAVHAQALAPTLAKSADPANGEIVVTATKRAESIQRVPISLQALGTVTLAQHQVQTFDDFAKLLPSVSYQSLGPGQSQIYFRGITTAPEGIASGPLPTSGLYVDEIPLQTIGGSVDFHVYDINRVEALSGPQGTLFGASSLSGTLRIITNQPDPSRYSAGYDLQGSKYGAGNAGGQGEAFVNIPLGERSAIRLVGFYDHEGGYIDNDYATRTYLRPNTHSADGSVVNSPLTVNNSRYARQNFNSVDTYGGRALVKVGLGDNWTVTPGVTYQHQKSSGTFLYDPRAGDLKVHDFTPDHTKDQWYLASLVVQGKISDWDVTYAGGYFERTTDIVQDYSYFSVAYDALPNYNFYQDALGGDIDPTQIYHAHDQYSKMSHEIRISSPRDEPLRVTAGAFMQRQTDKHIADYEIDGLAHAAVYYDLPVPGANSNDVFYTNIYRVDRDYAIFGEASWDIRPSLTLTGGIRGFKANNSLLGFSGQAPTLPQFNCTGTAQQCFSINKDYKGSGETHKVDIAWQVDRTHMVYFTYSTGFRPGGNNRPAYALQQVQNIGPYVADTLTNYELGWKTSWFNHALRVNGALFWEDWSNVQYGLPGILGIDYTVNAGTARSRGIEGDIAWAVDHHLTVSASGTYVDARLTSSFCASAGCVTTAANPDAQTLAPAGTRLPITPRLKITGTARYDFKVSRYNSFLQGTINHQGGAPQYLTTIGEAIVGPTMGFTTIDFSGGFSFANWSASLFIQNAFDKRGILSKNLVCVPTICGGYDRYYPIKPAYFGIRVSQRF